MQLRALGPVTLVDDGTVLPIEVSKHRALLAALALREREMVTISELIDALWGDDPPATAIKTLQGYVSTLRREFGPDLIETEPGGYRLGPAVDKVDVSEFEQTITIGRELLEQHQPRAARAAFDTSIRLWRGDPLVDLADGAVRTGHHQRLVERHLLAIEGSIEADLALGHHREVVPELEQLVVAHPYREFFWRALMLALYRSGRATAALNAYATLRTVLVEDVGLDPSAETQQLEHRILDADPALDPPSPAPPTNLPTPLDSFVDRIEERRSVIALLEQHRCVAVLGVGGAGKTRLANEVGRALVDDTPGGVWWIDLAPETEGVSFVRLVASAMDLGISSTGSVETVLLTRLRRTPTMLVLDNCEHVAQPAAAFVKWVTTHAPTVRVLVTSRVPLDVQGAQRLVLQPLETRPRDDAECSDAVQLFVDRLAERAAGDARDVVEADAIVELVGGLPLGIELAAARCATTGPTDLARSLREHEVLLSMTDCERDDDRHASLRHVFEASLEAIPATLATQLSRLTVFPGDFDLAAAAAVLRSTRLEAEQSVARLISVSLLQRSIPTAHRRFVLIWPIRELMDERLDDENRQDALECHARHFQALAGSLLGAAETEAEPDRIDQIGIDRHNVLAALSWFEQRDPDGALVFGPALGLEHRLRGDQHVGRDLLRRLVARAPNGPEVPIAWTEEELAWPEFLAGDIDEALTHNQDAIARFEKLGDPRGLARALRGRAHMLHLAGAAEAVTTPIYRRSIEVARAADLEYSTAASQIEFAHSLTASEQFDVVDVESMLAAAEDVMRRHRDHSSLAHAALSRGFIAFSRDDVAGGRTAGEAMLRESRLAHAPMWEQVAMTMLGVMAHQEGATAESAHWLRDAVHLARDTDNRAQLGIALRSLAAVFAGRAPEAAARLWGMADTLTPTWPLFLRRYGEWLDAARLALGDRFDELVAAGARMTLDDAVLLADALP